MLIGAFAAGDDDLHGWAIMKAAKRSGPTVYGVLDRLEDMGWIIGHWEDQPSEPGKPRRRFYCFTAEGIAGARETLLVRRPEVLQAALHAPGPLPRAWRGLPRQAGAS